MAIGFPGLCLYDGYKTGPSREDLQFQVSVNVHRVVEEGGTQSGKIQGWGLPARDTGEIHIKILYHFMLAGAVPCLFCMAMRSLGS